MLIGAFIGYFVYQQMGGQNTVVVSNNKNNQPTQAVDTKKLVSNNNQSKTLTYKDGAYTGPLTDAYYGNVQVSAIIKNGALTDVQFLDYPQKSGHSIEISNNVMPILRTEAIQSQNANVNAVSGETQTVEAFQQSLAGALALAQK